MASFPHSKNRGGIRRLPVALLAGLFAVLLLVPAGGAGGASMQGPGATRIVKKPGRIVPVPADIPHQAGSRIDSRLIANLRWLQKRFPFYVTEGYAGPLRNVGTVGCPGCHVSGSDHFYAAAVDVVALDFSTSCSRRWRPVTRLAHWSEPRQNVPVRPFRWIGYDGDSGHGCGHHLHLSWNHAPGRLYRPAAWIEVFRADFTGTSTPPRKPPPTGGQDGPSGPAGAETGGVSARMVADR
ncbi:MAG TPA: hypothetical protein VKA89_04070 [Solirubrobacterales bacterium]|nr:hypothetical protein [Solirubrobacterales bacterium]